MDSFFNPASPGSEAIHHLFVQFLWIAGFVFLLVTGLVLYFSHRFRATPGDDREPRPLHGNRKLEIGILATVTGIMGIYLYLALQTMVSVQAAPAEGQQPDLVIIGHQWWWEARYPTSGAVAANEIHIPAGKKLLLEVSSADVIHDWWVPALGRKMDVFPGRKNQVWMEANEPGTYQGVCSEFCGAQHAWMRINVIAHSPEEFADWEQQQLKKAIVPQVSLAQQGADLFADKPCASCHRIEGTAAQADIGPNLTHLGSRKTLLSGMMDNTQENLKRWLAHPQKVKPGAHMPDFLFTDEELSALVAYLGSLK